MATVNRAVRRHVAFLLAMLSLATLVGVRDANAVGMVIQGYVYDAANRPLAGVLVSDGVGQSDLTDAMGFYAISETIPQTYNITYSRDGLVSFVRSVTAVQALQNINVTLKYQLTSILTPRVVNEPPSTLTITVATFAPSSGLCVVFSSGNRNIVLVLTKEYADGRS